MMLMQKRPQHRIIIPDEIWDFYAKLHNKLDPADDMRRVLMERMKLLDTPIQQAKINDAKPEEHGIVECDRDIKDWCDYMMRNDYYGQCANEGYQSMHYQVITGKYKDSGLPVANSLRNKTFAMIKDKEKECNLWAAVMSGFERYMRDGK